MDGTDHVADTIASPDLHARRLSRSQEIPGCSSATHSPGRSSARLAPDYHVILGQPRVGETVSIQVPETHGCGRLEPARRAVRPSRFHLVQGAARGAHRRHEPEAHHASDLPHQQRGPVPGRQLPVTAAALAAMAPDRRPAMPRSRWRARTRSAPSFTRPISLRTRSRGSQRPSRVSPTSTRSATRSPSGSTTRLASTRSSRTESRPHRRGVLVGSRDRRPPGRRLVPDAGQPQRCGRLGLASAGRGCSSTGLRVTARTPAWRRLTAVTPSQAR